MGGFSWGRGLGEQETRNCWTVWEAGGRGKKPILLSRGGEKNIKEDPSELVVSGLKKLKGFSS